MIYKVEINLILFLMQKFINTKKDSVLQKFFFCFIRISFFLISTILKEISDQRRRNISNIV